MHVSDEELKLWASLSMRVCIRLVLSHPLRMGVSSCPVS